MKTNVTLAQMPKVPANSSFSLQKIETVSLPHPYCITPRHVAYASNHCSGILGEEAIKGAERAGAVCDICRKNGQILSYDNHENMVTLFIRVPQNRDLNAIPGLGKYLSDNKPTFESLGIQGFAFPT